MYIIFYQYRDSPTREFFTDLRPNERYRYWSFQAKEAALYRTAEDARKRLGEVAPRYLDSECVKIRYTHPLNLQ